MRGSMREREPGRWELRVDLGRDPLTGRRRQRSRTVYGGRRQAETALAELVADARAASAPGTDAPVSVLLDRWLELATRDLSPTTVAEYRRLAKVRVVPAIGDVPLDRLTAAHLDGLYVALQASGLSASSVMRVHALVRRALGQAMRWGWAERNVALGASPPSVSTPTLDLPGVEVLPGLLAAAHAYDDAVGVAVEVAARTGMRRGEVCGLQWRDVLDGELWVRRSVVDLSGHLTVKGTKTGRDRRVSIGSALVGVLEGRRRRVQDRAAECGVRVGGDGFVCSRDPGGAVPLRPEALSKAWAKVCADAGVRVRLHDLRHLHATVLIDAGQPVTTVAARLGHARTSMTLDVYAHAVGARDQVAADVFDEVLSAAGDEDAADGADGAGGGGPCDGGVGAAGGEEEGAGEGDDGQ